MQKDNPTIIVSAQALDRRLPGLDPFIFGAYHQDHYPKARLAQQLDGRVEAPQVPDASGNSKV